MSRPWTPAPRGAGVDATPSVRVARGEQRTGVPLQPPHPHRAAPGRHDVEALGAALRVDRAVGTAAGPEVLRRVLVALSAP